MWNGFLKLWNPTRRARFQKPLRKPDPSSEHRTTWRPILQALRIVWLIDACINWFILKLLLKVEWILNLFSGTISRITMKKWNHHDKCHELTENASVLSSFQRRGMTLWWRGPRQRVPTTSAVNGPPYGIATSLAQQLPQLLQAPKTYLEQQLFLQMARRPAQQSPLPVAIVPPLLLQLRRVPTTEGWHLGTTIGWLSMTMNCYFQCPLIIIPSIAMN